MLKPVTWTFGKRVYVSRSPLVNLFGWILIIVLLIPTLPLHIVIYLVNGTGFIKRRGRSWNYAPPTWAFLGCLIFTIAVMLLLVF